VGGVNRPAASSASALARMRQQRRRDTKPEMALRRAVHALGFRYRVDVTVLPDIRRRADLVFPTEQVAVFVDGCFWHGCPTHSTAPRANAAWWADKLAANRARDLDTNRRLGAAGWHVERVWEHEDPCDGAQRVAAALCHRRAGRPPERNITAHPPPRTAESGPQGDPPSGLALEGWGTTSGVSGHPDRKGPRFSANGP